MVRTIYCKFVRQMETKCYPLDSVKRTIDQSVTNCTNHCGEQERECFAVLQHLLHVLRCKIYSAHEHTESHMYMHSVHLCDTEVTLN